MPCTTDFSANEIQLNGGLKIHYFKKAGGDLNLVFLHPSSGYGRMWELTAGDLDPRFTSMRRISAVMATAAALMASIRQRSWREICLLSSKNAGLKRIVVGGHSLGGRVALAFAAFYPEVTAGLIMVAGPHLSNFYQTREAVQTVTPPRTRRWCRRPSLPRAPMRSLLSASFGQKIPSSRLSTASTST